MDLQLTSKTAFISGSTSGIGLACAKQLLQEGATVIVNGRDESRISSAIKELRTQIPGAKVEGLVADFASKESVELLMAKLPEIDILVNNVGIYASRPFQDITDQEWYDQIEVNVMSGVRLSRTLLPKMLQKGWGRILFISSECAALVPEDLIPYSTTKAAVLAVSRGLAQLTRGTGVTVNTILPGSTMTPGAENFIEGLARDRDKTVEQVERDFFQENRPNSLLQRFATEEEVAATIVYYCSTLAAATNGDAIKVDGGSIGGII